MAHLVWAGVVLILGLYFLTLWAFHLRDLRERNLKVETDLAELRKQTELELVAAKKLLLDISGGLEARIRDLEMKVN